MAVRVIIGIIGKSQGQVPASMITTPGYNHHLRPFVLRLSAQPLSPVTPPMKSFNISGLSITPSKKHS